MGEFTMKPAQTGASPMPGVTVCSRKSLVMLDMRLARSASQQAVEAVLGTSLPLPLRSNQCADGTILRLSPNQWLLVAQQGGRWSEELSLPGASVCDVSHGRIALRLSGPHVRDALGKGCMVDLNPGVFQPEMCIQTAIDKVPVIVNRLEGVDAAYDLYAARSYAASFRHWLAEAAREYGCELTDW